MKQLVLIALCACLLWGGGQAYGGVIGNTSAGTLRLTLENQQTGVTMASGMSPSGMGDWDSVTAYIRLGANDPAITYNCRCAVIKRDSLRGTPNFDIWGSAVDSSAPFTIAGGTSVIDTWVSTPMTLNGVADPAFTYMPLIWCKSQLGTIELFYSASADGDSLISKSRTWTSFPWTPDLNYPYSTALKSSIYATYSLTPSGLPAKRRIEQQRMIRSELWREVTRTFAENKDEIPD